MRRATAEAIGWTLGASVAVAFALVEGVERTLRCAPGRRILGRVYTWRS